MGVRRGKQGDDGAPDRKCHLLREQLRMVEPSASASLAGGGNEGDSRHLARDLGGKVARHVSRHFRRKPLLASVFVDDDDAARALGELERAREARERHVLAACCSEHHGVAFGALRLSPGGAADGARAPKVDEGKLASAAFAQKLTWFVADGAAGGPKRFRDSLCCRLGIEVRGAEKGACREGCHSADCSEQFLQMVRAHLVEMRRDGNRGDRAFPTSCGDFYQHCQDSAGFPVGISPGVRIFLLPFAPAIRKNLARTWRAQTGGKPDAQNPW